MGVDCRIVLPGNVRVEDVATVIGAAAGLDKYKAVFGVDQLLQWSAEVEGVKLDRSTSHSMVTICLYGECADERKEHTIHYFFEYGSKRLLLVRSSAFWIAVGRKLVDFFGGSIDYKDCDSVDADYSVPEKSDAENCPEDGDDWQRLQERIFAIEPITVADLEHFQQFAAY